MESLWLEAPFTIRGGEQAGTHMASAGASKGALPSHRPGSHRPDHRRPRGNSQVAIWPGLAGEVGRSVWAQLPQLLPKAKVRVRKASPSLSQQLSQTCRQDRP